MATIKLDYVQEFRDRHGKVRRYFRRAGCKRIPLLGAPYSAEFMEAYQAALTGSGPPTVIGASRTVPGTVHALVAAYLDISANSTSPFKTFAPETQRTRRNILENFRKADGEMRIFRTEPNGRRVMLLAREHMQRIVNAKAATPFAQRNFLNTVRAMFDWAVDEGRVPENPTLGVKRRKVKAKGRKAWSEAEVARFEAHWPIGTTARLTFALAKYTGARLSDVAAMGPHTIVDGVVSFSQHKTDGPVDMPPHPELAKIIAATPTTGIKTFVVTGFGKPYTVKGLGNAMRDWCDAAGCPEVSAHGLRGRMASTLAERGASDHQIMSITGHASSSEVGKYTKAARRKRMAREAMALLIEDDAADGK
jgi:integrase